MYSHKKRINAKEKADHGNTLLSKNKKPDEVVPNKGLEETENRYELAAIVKNDSMMSDILLREAVTGENAADWMKAVAEEIRHLIRKKAWDLVDRPSNRDVATCRTILRNKINTYESLKRRKPRVAGTDYGEIFAPVAHLDS